MFLSMYIAVGNGNIWKTLGANSYWMLASKSIKSVALVNDDVNSYS
jgi:hypothetical protein